MSQMYWQTVQASRAGGSKGTIAKIIMSSCGRESISIITIEAGHSIECILHNSSRRPCGAVLLSGSQRKYTAPHDCLVATVAICTL